VIFTEKSLTVVAKIDLTASLGFVVTATFTCTPSSAPAFMALAAQPGQVVTTTTLSPITTVPTTTPGPTVAGSTDPSSTTVAAAATTSGTPSGTLPRTGLNALLFLIIAAVLLDAGLAMIALTRRRRLGDS
jgi:uncharacterized surface anchored protein